MKTVLKWLGWLASLLVSLAFWLVWAVLIIVGICVIVVMVVTLWQQIVKLDWMRSVVLPIACAGFGFLFLFGIGPAAVRRLKQLPWRKQ